MKRRLFLSAFGALALAGCKDSKETVKNISPVPFDRHDRCHLCGMVISHYEGPKAEVFLKNVEEALKFCSVRDAFTYALQPENKRRITAFFVHPLDLGSWDKPFEGQLLPADKCLYLYGSDKEGVMGVEPIPFGDKTKAEEFKKTHGGRILSYPEVTLKVLNE